LILIIFPDAMGIKLKGEEMNGTDEYDFTVLGAGYRYDQGYFLGLGTYAGFWTSSTNETLTHGKSFVFQKTFQGMNIQNTTKAYGYSVRCLED